MASGDSNVAQLHTAQPNPANLDRLEQQVRGLLEAAGWDRNDVLVESGQLVLDCIKLAVTEALEGLTTVEAWEATLPLVKEFGDIPTEAGLPPTIMASATHTSHRLAATFLAEALLLRLYPHLSRR